MIGPSWFRQGGCENGEVGSAKPASRLFVNYSIDDLLFSKIVLPRFGCTYPSLQTSVFFYGGLLGLFAVLQPLNNFAVQAAVIFFSLRDKPAFQVRR
jgi:hypothetical protein